MHIENRPEPQQMDFRIVFGNDHEGYAAAYAIESIVLKGAEALATLHEGGADGRPAVTIHAFGRGAVVYVGADSNDL